MNTKSIPAILALVAGFVTCIISFMQHADTTVFVKRFVIVCIVFFIIGTVISVVINMNFKDMAVDEESGSEEEEQVEEQEEEETAKEEE